MNLSRQKYTTLFQLKLAMLSSNINVALYQNLSQNRFWKTARKTTSQLHTTAASLHDQANSTHDVVLRKLTMKVKVIICRPMPELAKTFQNRDTQNDCLADIVSQNTDLP